MNQCHDFRKENMLLPLTNALIRENFYDLKIDELLRVRLKVFHVKTGGRRGGWGGGGGLHSSNPILFTFRNNPLN